MSGGRTPSQTVGPFFTLGMCRAPQNEIVAGGDVLLRGRVFDGAGEPIPDAVVEIWQPGPEGTRWGRCGTDATGTYSFTTEKPAGEGGAPALDVIVFARGLLRHLVTRVYFPDEAEANASDPVLSAVEPGQQSKLVAEEEGGGALSFDIHLQGDEQTVFFAV